MSMEYVKPFGEYVEETNRITLYLSESKVKVHFMRFGLFPNLDYNKGKDGSPVWDKYQYKEENKKLDGLLESHRGNSVEEETNAYSPRAIKDNIPNVKLKNMTVPDRQDHSFFPAMFTEELFQLKSHYPLATEIFSRYLYIYHPNQGESDSLEEYYIDEDGKLCEISLNPSDNMDIRVPNKSITPLDVYVYENKGSHGEPEIWAALSPIQWTASRIEKMKEPDFRAERMQKIICKPKVVGERSPNDAFDYISYADDITVASYSEVKKECRISSKLNDVVASRPEEGDEFDDIFVSLHDPIFMADRICKCIEDQAERLSDLVMALKSDPEDPCGKKSKDLHFLHLLALTSYRFVFSSANTDQNYVAKGFTPVLKEALKCISITNPFLSLKYLSGAPIKPFTIIEKLDQVDGVSENAILKVLAVVERKKIRETIDTYRNDLAIFLRTDYYQNGLNDYFENVEVHRQDGRVVASDHLYSLAFLPDSIDGYIDLPAEVSAEDERFNELREVEEAWFSEGDCLSFMFPMSMQLIDVELDFDRFYKEVVLEEELQCSNYLRVMAGSDDEVNKAYLDKAYSWGESTTDKIVTASFFKRSLKASRKLGSVVSAYRKLYFKAIGFKKRSDNITTVRFSSEKMEVFKKENKMIIEVMENKGVQLVEKNKNVHILKFNSDYDLKKSIRFSGKGLIRMKEPNVAHKEVIKKIINSPGMAAVTALFQLNSVLEAWQAKDDKAGWGADLISESIKLTDSLGRLIRPASIFGSKFLAKTALSAFGALGAFASALIYINDAQGLLILGDNDAAFFLGIAGAASIVEGVLLAYAIFIPELSLAWPLLILAGIVLVATILAAYLTDGELERFFKNFSLSLKMTKNISQQSSLAYISELYLNMKAVCSDTVAPSLSKSFEGVYVTLSDLISPVSVSGCAFYKSDKALKSKSIVRLGPSLVVGDGVPYVREYEYTPISQFCLVVKLASKDLIKEETLDIKIFLTNDQTNEGFFDEFDLFLKYHKAEKVNGELTGFHFQRISIKPKSLAKGLSDLNRIYILFRMTGNDAYGSVPVDHQGEKRYFVFTSKLYLAVTKEEVSDAQEALYVWGQVGKNVDGHFQLLYPLKDEVLYGSKKQNVRVVSEGQLAENLIVAKGVGDLSGYWGDIEAELNERWR